MPDETPKNLIDIRAAHGVFPLTQMLETGLWSALSAEPPDLGRRCRGVRPVGDEGPEGDGGHRPRGGHPQPRPRTNTYRLQWENLKVPQEQARPQGKKARSPFVMPKTHKVPEVPLAEEEDGPGKLPWSKVEADSGLGSSDVRACHRRRPSRCWVEQVHRAGGSPPPPPPR